MKRLILISFLLIVSRAAFAAFGYYSPVSINSAQVPSTQTDFPVLVSVTDARFKTVANSGHVQNSSGFDIRPYTNSTLTTAITGYELERFNGSTGEVVMWVKVSSLTSSSTPFVLAYGDATISTDGSSTTTWSNSFISVYHLKDGTTLSVADALGTNNGTNHSATAATGKIDGGGGFVSASSQYVDIGSYTGPSAVTVSCWVNGTSFPNAYNTTLLRNSTQSQWGIMIKSNGKLGCFVVALSGQVSYDGTGSNTLSTGTWYLLHLTYSVSAGLIGYVNAASDNTAVQLGTLITAAGTGGTDIGQDPRNAGRFWNGSLDEARIASVARSADWITTEYNNQSAPGTFETLGAESSVYQPICSSSISINAAQVPSTQTDFPVLVSVTDNRFKTVANGGSVANANGYDIRPYSDSALTTAITGYELERYNGTTGEVVMWVKVASLSSSTTPIYLRYGDSTLNTDGSSTTTWSNNFGAVYHLKDGTTLSLADSTSGAHTGTNNSVTATSGKIDGAGSFVSASSQYIDCGTTIQNGFSAVTISAWVNATSFPNAYNGIGGWDASSPTRQAMIWVKSTGKMTFFVQAVGSVGFDGTGSHTLSSATDYLIHMTYSSSAGLVGYVNAASDGTAAANGSLANPNSVTFDIGQDPLTAGRFWNGKIDELRVASVSRSADWITTEYNNQSAPGTFETLGSQTCAANTVGSFFNSD